MCLYTSKCALFAAVCAKNVFRVSQQQLTSLSEHSCIPTPDPMHSGTLISLCIIDTLGISHCNELYDISAELLSQGPAGTAELLLTCVPCTGEPATNTGLVAQAGTHLVTHNGTS